MTFDKSGEIVSFMTRSFALFVLLFVYVSENGAVLYFRASKGSCLFFCCAVCCLLMFMLGCSTFFATEMCMYVNSSEFYRHFFERENVCCLIFTKLYVGFTWFFFSPFAMATLADLLESFFPFDAQCFGILFSLFISLFIRNDCSFMKQRVSMYVFVHFDSLRCVQFTFHFVNKISQIVCAVKERRGGRRVERAELLHFTSFYTPLAFICAIAH